MLGKCGNLLAAAIAGLLTALFSGTAWAAEQPLAEELTAQITLDGSPAPLLADANRTTKLKLAQGAALQIHSGTPAAFLYLVWDKAPGAGTLAVGGHGEFPIGGNGFLHELIALEEPAAEASLSWEASEGAVLCDVRLLSAGTLPDWAQAWEPPLERAELLVLPTHADDEHLYFGGSMPYYAAHPEVNVQVAYMVNHNGEPYRPHELLNGLWTVGIRNYPVIPEFPDIYSLSLEHAKTVYSEEEITAYQVELLRRFRPYVVVGHDQKGEYGHGAHMLNAWCLERAAEAAGDPERFPDSARQYGAWDVPKTYLHLYGEDPLIMDWDQPLDAFDGATAYEMAVKGYACHASQQGFFQMEPAGPYDCRKFGLLRTTVGPDIVKNDFFENIHWTPAEPESVPLEEAPAVEPAGQALPEGKPPAWPEPGGLLAGNSRIPSALAAACMIVPLTAAILLIWRRFRKGNTGGL